MPLQGKQDFHMLEAAKEYNKTPDILYFKYTEHVMNIMEVWMTLYEMKGANMKHNYKGRDGEALVKIKYRQPFGLHFRYHPQVDGYNNRHHFYILL